MKFEMGDFERLASEVRRFLSKADVMARMSVNPVLYLEFPDVGTMRAVHMGIVQAMTPLQMVMAGPTSSPWSFPDDHTIKYEPYAGVTIVLSCKQRFATKMRGSVAYRDIAFVDTSLPKLSEKE